MRPRMKHSTDAYNRLNVSTRQLAGSWGRVKIPPIRLSDVRQHAGSGRPGIIQRAPLGSARAINR